MAAGVAHEIRNPLSSVKGFATYFKERYKEIPEDREIADILIHEVERLDRVIGQLLDLSRPVKITPEPTDLKSFVDESLRLVQQKIEEKNIEVKIDFDLKKNTYAIDRDKLTQALLNLYLNAVEAMEENGVLGINVRGKNGDNGLEIAVSDTGSGIGDRDLMRIFDPYYTTKSSGTGLGLAIVHNIMEAHGGEIRLESEPDSGTTIRLIFPSKT